MIKNRPGSNSGSPSKIFAGVRFVLFGFDSVSEAQYRSELVGGGGTDVGRYDASCTHVIVCDRVYDDPVCVAAREDGKVLVTASWIEDSVNFETLADTRRVLYRPPKDMNGILGSKKLCICLTGYQRQEREDIMKMVSLMGARFTKPLVANEVTHLICYKFEGEKYELARKVKIKLTNHRWLEDCLKAWEILPIDNYTKSGWELEILEVEARDSEEETEDPFMDIQELRSAGGASISRGDLPVPLDPHVHSPTMGTSTIPKNASTSTIPKNASSLQAEMPTSADSHWSSPKKASIEQKCSAATVSRTTVNHLVDNNLSIPWKDNSFQKVLDRHMLNGSMEFDRQDTGSTAQKNDASLVEDAVGKGKLLNSSSSEIETIESKQSPDILKAKVGSSRSGGDERHGTPTGLLKTLDKPMPEEQHNPSCSPPKGNSEKKSTLGEAIIKYEQSPTAGSVLPQKRNLSVSWFGSKSAKSEGQESRVSPSHGTSVNMGECAQLEPTSAISVHHGVSVTGDNLERAALSDCKANEDTAPLKSKTLSYKKRSLKRRQPASNTKNSVTEGSPSIGNKTDLLQNAQSRQAMDNTISVNCEVLDLGFTHTVTSDHLESAALSDYKANDDTTPSKSKTLTYKKRSLRRRQPASNTKHSVTEGSPSIGNKTDLLQNAQSRQVLDNSTAVNCEVPDLGNRQAVTFISSLEDKMLRDWSLEHEPRRAVDVDGSLVDPTSVSESLVSRGRGKACPDEMTPVTHVDRPREPELTFMLDKDGDIAMTDVPGVTAQDTGEPQRNRLYKGVLSSDGKDSDTRKLSGTASTGTSRENAKTSLGVRTKKVASRRTLSSIPKSTTETANKEKNGTTEKNVNPEKAPLKPRKVEKLKAGIKEKKEAVEEVITYDIVNKDKAIAESSTKKIPKALMDPEKENKPKENDNLTFDVKSHPTSKVSSKDSKMSKCRQETKDVGSNSSKVVRTTSCMRVSRPEPVWFILSGHRLQRKEFRTAIKRLNGRCCRDSHNWSYQATHFIVPDPVRRTEKFFAAAAAGRWILKADYLTASSEAGKFLDAEPFEWYRKGLTEDGAVNLESPRKWRLLREKTGHGAFHGMRVLIYGECIAPSLDTLKRVVKAGDGTILATSPPYTRFLGSHVDYVVVSPSMPRVDSWIQEFLKHEIPCVVADYLVEYVCKAGYPLERHVLYNTHKWAEKSFTNLANRAEEIVIADGAIDPLDESGDDVSCSVCGATDREEVMLICGDEGGSVGCGSGMHIDCCDPPLEAVPTGDWFCPDCSRKRKTHRKSSNSKSSLKCK